MLTVLTVGLFRFWATTRTRRYTWSHMSFQGDRFEYAGTGLEKLRGFGAALVIVFALWLPNRAIEVAPPERVEAPRRLADRLARAADVPSVTVEVRHSQIVNAFALPVNHIVVLRGLLDRLDDGTEFAGVLAHEFGHVLRNDAIVAFVRAQALDAGVRVVGLQSELPTTLLSLSFSRAIEARADAASIRLLQAAHLRSDGLGRALARLNPSSSGGETSWLDDHPSTPGRIAAAAGSPDGDPPMERAAWVALRGICGPR